MVSKNFFKLDHRITLFNLIGIDLDIIDWGTPGFGFEISYNRDRYPRLLITFRIWRWELWITISINK